MELETCLTYFDGVRKTGNNQYMVRCPCHDDKKASLSITEKDNKILMNCFAGCKTKDIVHKVNLSEKDLFNNKISIEKETMEKEYLYTDEESRILYKVTKYKPKDFRPSQYINGRWQKNLQNVRRVPYNLPNVIKSDIIYWVEGERDADNLNKIGLVATTTVGGANSFSKYKSEYCKYFKGKIVFIIPDNDEPGLQYAKSIYEALNKIASKVKILDLKQEISDLKEKEDISDVLKVYGKVKVLEILDKLVSTEDLVDFSGQTLSKELLEKVLDKLNIKVGYNEITKEIDIVGLPEEYSSENAETILPIFLKEELKKYRIKSSKAYIEDLLILIFDSRRYNPIINMVQSKEWDKKDRFDQLFEIMNIEDEFDKILIRKWFWQTVAMAFNGYNKKKPYGIEGVLTLQGPQGCGKTRWCRNISLKTEWFTEGATIDTRNKDSLILASKGFVVELRRSRFNDKEKAI